MLGFRGGRAEVLGIWGMVRGFEGVGFPGATDESLRRLA